MSGQQGFSAEVQHGLRHVVLTRPGLTQPSPDTCGKNQGFRQNRFG
jgi:hypothetical protein